MTVRAADPVRQRARRTTAAGSAWRLRRWIRRRRRAGGAEGSLGSAYVVLLTVLIAGALVGEPLVGEFWLARPVPMTGLAADRSLALLALAPLALYAVLRRIGPVAIGRADLTWLLPAPVSRRGLLLPSALTALAGAALLGTLGGTLVVGRVAVRPVMPGAVLTGLLTGAAVGALTALTATVGQRYDRLGRVVDVAAVLGAAPLTAVAAGLWRPGARASELAAGLGGPGPGLVLAVAAALLLALVVRTLDWLPGHRIVDASMVRGGYLDVAVAVEPTFLAEQEQRRYWQRRRMRSVRLRRLPRWLLPVQHDLLVLCRRPAKLVALAGAVLAPAVALAGPWWLPAVVVPLGMLVVAGTTADAVRQDSIQPALLRLLGLTGRQAVAGRLLVPMLLAGGWAALALTVAGPLGDLAAGPWWALGPALAPVAAAAALRRASAGFVRHDLAHIETPAGTLATGPLLWLLSGVDLLALFGLPSLFVLLGGQALTWTTVLVQAAASVVCATWYLINARSRSASPGSG